MPGPLRGNAAGGLPGGSFYRQNNAAPPLLEHRPAGLAKARPLPAQAGGDGVDVGNFAGAKAVDVGRAGPLLFRRRELGERGTGREQRQNQAERHSGIRAAGQGPNAGRSCLHDSIPLS
jgi:hypothetical protein